MIQIMIDIDMATSRRTPENDVKYNESNRMIFLRNFSDEFDDIFDDIFDDEFDDIFDDEFALIVAATGLLKLNGFTSPMILSRSQFVGSDPLVSASVSFDLIFATFDTLVSSSDCVALIFTPDPVTKIAFGF